MDGWKDFIGRKVKIFFNDLNRVSYKEGILISITDIAFILDTGSKKEAISKNLLVRIEMEKDEKEEKDGKV